MALPKNELALNTPNYASPIHRDHIEVYTSRAYGQGHMVVEGNGIFRPCGLADENIAINEYGPIHIEGGIQVTTRRARAGELFNVWGDPVYYDITTLEYYATVPGGMNYPCVGFVTIPMDADGCFSFEKYRYAFIEPTT
jgi:hypothetical protein